MDDEISTLEGASTKSAVARAAGKDVVEECCWLKMGLQDQAQIWWHS